MIASERSHQSETILTYLNHLFFGPMKTNFNVKTLVLCKHYLADFLIDGLVIW